MTKANDLASLLDANGDVVSSALDNVPPSNDASALSTGTLPDGRFPAVLPAVSGANLTGIQAGAGYFDGNNGATGDTTNGKGDIFRVHSQTLSSNVTIGSTDNALAVGPLTLGSNVTLTVNGNLTVA